MRPDITGQAFNFHREIKQFTNLRISLVGHFQLTAFLQCFRMVILSSSGTISVIWLTLARGTPSALPVSLMAAGAASVPKVQSDRPFRCRIVP